MGFLDLAWIPLLLLRFTSRFLIASVALARRNLGFCFTSGILAQRSPYIDYIVQTAFFVSPDKSFILSGIDEFALARFSLS